MYHFGYGRFRFGKVIIFFSKYMIKNKHIDFGWSEWIEEGVCDEVQTVLDKADGAPPIVECPDGLDFEIGCDANQVGPGVGNNDNPEELLDTIDMNHMCVLNIEPAGFQTFEHRSMDHLSL